MGFHQEFSNVYHKRTPVFLILSWLIILTITTYLSGTIKCLLVWTSKSWLYLYSIHISNLVCHRNILKNQLFRKKFLEIIVLMTFLPESFFSSHLSISPPDIFFIDSLNSLHEEIGIIKTHLIFYISEKRIYDIIFLEKISTKKLRFENRMLRTQT